MFKQGLKAEVLSLKQQGATQASPAMKAIGYAEWFNPSLTNDEQVKEAIKKNTRNYAKRQLTFLKGLQPYAQTVELAD
jgi:tRNA dimethylallyltransferase